MWKYSVIDFSFETSNRSSWTMYTVLYLYSCYGCIFVLGQEPITRSEHLPYLLLELSFLQTELFLERLSRQANNAFVYWPTRAPHYFCNKWINYLEGRGNSKNWIVAGLQVGIQSAFRHIGSTANCTLNLPLRKHIFFRGKFKTKNNSVCENDISTKKRTLFAPSDGLLTRSKVLT